jgi:hypothetical protein
MHATYCSNAASVSFNSPNPLVSQITFLKRSLSFWKNTDGYELEKLRIKAIIDYFKKLFDIFLEQLNYEEQQTV